MVEAREQPEARRSPYPRLAMMAVLAALVVVAVVAAWSLWSGMQETAIGTQGLIALTIGIVVTVLLGGGLGALVIISNRRGFDERVGRD